MNLPPLPPMPPMYHDDGWHFEDLKAYARAYGESCARMAREEAAKVCDAQREIYDTKMAEALELGREERWDRFHACAEAVEYIAAAIRKV